MCPLRRIRNASARELRVLLLGATALNVATFIYVIAYVPLVRLQPICTDQNSPSIFAPDVEIGGKMAYAFFREFQTALKGWNYLVFQDHIYLTVFDWLSRRQVAEASRQATVNLLAEHLGAYPREIREQRLGIPEFDEVERYDWPPCGAMRKLAIAGGEWAIVGPRKLVPERAKGRIVPLPHLTDPLLFEPVLPRGPAAIDGQGDAGDAGGGVAR